MDSRICEQCVHYEKEEYVNGDCQFSADGNPDYCQFKPKEKES